MLTLARRLLPSAVRMPEDARFLRMRKPLTVYKASAGSGKTFTLAAEYIALLAVDPECYKNILAVTFTNKATKEMKMRILSQLYGISHELKESEPYVRSITETTTVDRERLSRQADAALHNLMHDYSFFKVETIDAFFQRILRNMSRELNLAANLQLRLDDEMIGELAVDSMIGEIESGSPLLSRLMEYIEARMDDDLAWNIIGEIKRFGTLVFKDFYKQRAEQISGTVEDDNFFKGYRRTIGEIASAALRRMQEQADKFFDELEREGLQPDMLTNKGRGIASYFAKLRRGKLSEKDCVNKTLEKHIDSAEAWATKKSPRRDQVVEVAERVLLPLLRETERMRRAEAKKYYSASLTLKNLHKLRLLSSIEKKVRKMTDEGGWFMLNDTPTLLEGMIDGSDAPFIFEKIGSLLDYIMIDEFQDTSRTQWASLKVLLRDCMSRAKSGNLIVGDVKQSIYRWRSSDWKLLDRVEQEFDDADRQLEVKALNTNFRSERNVVEFNNCFFETAAEKTAQEEEKISRDGAEQIRNAYDDVAQMVPADKPNAGLVRVVLLPGNEYKEATLHKIAEHVDTLLEAGVRANDIAILVRMNRDIPVIADYLMQAKPEVNVVSDEAFRLDASLAVRAIVQALYFLLHPEDKLAKANLWKSYTMIGGRDLTPQSMEDIVLPDEIICNDAHLLKLPLTELIERLRGILGLSGYHDEDAYLSAFNDCVTAFVADNPAGVDDFLEQWDSVFCAKTIPADAANGIRIVSIHKSKGLEFDSVIVPFCDWELSKPHTVWCSPKEAPYNELEIVPIDYNDAMRDSIYADEYVEEHTQNSIDNLNLLYVAFTRAARNLFIIGKRTKNLKDDDIGGNRSKLIEQVLPLVGERLPGSVYENEDENETTTFRYGDLSVNRKDSIGSDEKEVNIFTEKEEEIDVYIDTFVAPVEFKQSNASREFIEGDYDKSQYIKTGSLLHNIFARIRTLDDVPVITRELQAGGLSDPKELTVGKVMALLEKSLANPRVREWFSPRWTLFNECSIIFENEKGEIQTRRPDRVITDGKTTVVIDFKFGLQGKTEYLSQVGEYMQLLRDMGYANVCGFIWYFSLGRIEEVKA